MSKKKRREISNIYKIIIILIDIFILNFSIYLSFVIKFNGNIPYRNFSAYEGIIPYISIASLAFLNIFGLFSMFRKNKFEAAYSSFLVALMLFLTTAALTFFNRGFTFPRTVLILALIFQFIFLSLWRTYVWILSLKFFGKKKIMYVGNNFEEIRFRFLEDPTYEVVRSVKANNRDIFMKLNNFIEIEDIEGLIIGEGINGNVYSYILKIAYDKKIEIYKIPEFFDIALINSKIVQIGDGALLKMSDVGLSLEKRIAKRMFDLIIALIVFIVTSPIMLVCAILIKISSKGKVMYCQERITINHKVFKIYKFRTMVEDAEKFTGPTLCTEEDARVTRIGKFLRKTRLDELPQLFNVIRGEMSVVGPRPERPYFVEKYEQDIEEYKYRTCVKAGITGLAQIMGRYSTDANDKVKYDMAYIKNYSIFLDMVIIFKTLKIVFSFDVAKGIKEKKESF